MQQVENSNPETIDRLKAFRTLYQNILEHFENGMKDNDAAELGKKEVNDKNEIENRRKIIDTVIKPTLKLVNELKEKELRARKIYMIKFFDDLKIPGDKETWTWNKEVQEKFDSEIVDNTRWIDNKRCSNILEEFSKKLRISRLAIYLIL